MAGRKERALRWYHAQTPEQKRERWLKRAYGLSAADYEAMLIKQKGQCAICGATPPTLHVDHNHTTGEVRALLCGSCNRAIGLMQEDTSRLRAAADYLERT